MNSIVLTGFMGTGKTTVGKFLAHRLGIPFVDLDDVIEQTAGKSIADIFRGDGEEHFRELETKAIEKVSDGKGKVLATGGGAILRKQNVTRLKLLGAVVLLEAKPGDILARVSGGPERPLLGGYDDKLARIRQLLKERRRAYSVADYSFGTSNCPPEQVAAEVEKIYRQWHDPSTLSVTTPSGGYSVIIRPGLLRECGGILDGLGLRGKVFLVTDRNVAQSYGDLCVGSLESAGFEVETEALPVGERTKSVKYLIRLLDGMASFGLTRDSTVICLGGGVVGDVGGFAASIYMRGVNLVHLPTSLVAQVDSAMGGKVGIDHPLGKNLIGSFYNPRVVIADPLCLQTLTRREFRAGLAEVVKYALIRDEALFGFLEAKGKKVLRREPETLRHILLRCCQIKAEIVEQDEKETVGIREFLNYGHTFGHAFEAAAGYRGLKHGEAVAVGMAAAARLAVRMGVLPTSEAERQNAIFSRLGLPLKVKAISPEEAYEFTGMDKKMRSGARRFVILDGKIGACRVITDPPEELVREAFSSVCEA